MKKHIVYLAGPIAGIPDYMERFAEAERDFSKTGYYKVINPARLLEGIDDKDCLPLCLQLLERSDSVVCLPGWRNSLGAVTEVHFALRQGKSVIEYLNKSHCRPVTWDSYKLSGDD